jgi:hypothetical protein
MTQETGKLADALAKAQAMFKPIKKDKTAKVRMKAGGEYSYNYSDLSSVIDATKEGLSSNGLAVTQLPEFQSERLVLHTKLMHSSGEIVSCMWPLPPPHTPAQEMGSALTYARRYSMSAILGVASEDDDDGAAGNEATHSKPAPKPVQQAPAKPNGAYHLLDPRTGEFIPYTKIVDWLNQFEKNLNEKDNPLDWFDCNSATFNLIQGKLSTSPQGLAHCKRIVDLVSEIQKAQTAPLDTPDYSTAA